MYKQYKRWCKHIKSIKSGLQTPASVGRPECGGPILYLL